jgi:hypothetical protein
MKEDKSVPVDTSIPVPRNAIAPGFKLVKVRKPDGKIVTVKRPIAVVAPKALASTTIEAISVDRPAISATGTIEPAPVRVDPSTAVPTEITKVPANNDGTELAETLAVKLEIAEKGKISLAWLGKKEKPTTTNDKEAEKSKSRFSKLRATVGNTTKRMDAKGNAVSRIGALLDGDTVENAKPDAAKPTAAAASDPTNPVTTPKKSVVITSTPSNQTVSKNTSTTTSRNSYRNPNNNDDERNAAVDAGATNDAEIYDEWNSGDEEVDLSDVGGGYDDLDTQGLDAGPGDPVVEPVDPSSQVDDDDDSIQDFNPDTDEVLDEGVDSIEDFNPDTDEVLDELDDTDPITDQGDNSSNLFVDVVDDGGITLDDD